MSSTLSVGRLNATKCFALWCLGLLASAPAAALEFERDLVQGIVNLDVSYGITYPLDEPDSGFIGIANGGTEASVNGDDGELNQKHGIVSQMMRGTGELILAFENFGIYARAAAFHDWVEDGNLSRTKVTPAGRELVGSDTNLLEHYIAGQVTVAETLVYFRVGDQVTWQGTSFVRDGLDLISPYDFATTLQPAARSLDNRKPGRDGLGRIEPHRCNRGRRLLPIRLETRGAATGWNRVQYARPLRWRRGARSRRVLGAGQISDLGTNPDQQFALPTGTLGFDPEFDRMPGRAVEPPMKSRLCASG